MEGVITAIFPWSAPLPGLLLTRRCFSNLCLAQLKTMEDSFSSVVTATNNNLTRLSRTVATTATTLSSTYGELAAPTYQQAMQDLSSPLFRKRLFSFQARTSPSEIVKSSLTTDATRFRLLTSLPDNLLQSLPTPQTEYSLYQGFVATQSAGAGDTTQELEACAIRKELATCEINELDARIAELKKMRQVVFDKVAELEREERRIEKESSDGPALIENGSADLGKTPLKLEYSEKHSNGHASASTSSQAKTHNARRRSMRKRVVPTLQKFYAAGDTICKLDTGTDPVAMVDFNAPFGTLVAATGPRLQVWDLGSGERTGLLEGHDAAIQCLQMEDALVVTGSNDASVRLWDVQEGSHIHTLAGHLDAVTTLHFDDNVLVTGSNDKTIRQWDLDTGRCVQTLDVLWTRPSEGWASAGSVGALQNFDAALATGTADGIVRLWDLRTGRVQRTLAGHMGPVTCLQFDDVHLVSGSLDNSIRVWDLRAGSVIDVLNYSSGISSLHFDSSRIVAATNQPVIQVYDRHTRSKWTCGPGDTDSTAAPVTAVRQQKGYLVGGQVSGEIGVWAC